MIEGIVGIVGMGVGRLGMIPLHVFSLLDK
jgi:hypothetical protein